MRQFEALLHAPAPLAAAPNLAALWARLLVEELCRLGASTFCVAPGQHSCLFCLLLALLIGAGNCLSRKRAALVLHQAS